MRRKIAVLFAIVILSHTMQVFAGGAEGVGKPDAVGETDSADAMKPETAEVINEDTESETAEVINEDTGLGTAEVINEDTGSGTAKVVSESAESETAEVINEDAESETDEVVSESAESETAEVINENIESKTEEVLYSVSFPMDIHAFLDPEDLSGKGQIFSSQYKVENYGNTDVIIKINNIDIYYLSTEDIYELSEEAVTDHHSRTKKMNIDMVWMNEAEQMETILHVSEGAPDEPVLFLKAAKYDENGEFVSLCDGCTGFFYFTGTLNANPNIVWDDGELIVTFDYEIVNQGVIVYTEEDVMDINIDEESEEDDEMIEDMGGTEEEKDSEDFTGTGNGTDYENMDEAEESNEIIENQENTNSTENKDNQEILDNENIEKQEDIDKQ